MGELADYMINGDDCESCGMYIGPGPGHPRRCRECGPAPRPKRKKKKLNGPAPPFAIRKKDRAWLEHIAFVSHEYDDKMYAGLVSSMLPTTVGRRLSAARMIESVTPNNPVHKPRWIITPKGIELIA